MNRVSSYPSGSLDISIDLTVKCVGGKKERITTQLPSHGSFCLFYTVVLMLKEFIPPLDGD